MEKCRHCQRRDDCTLREHAQDTLPWVVDALSCGATDWERTHAVRSALRGSGSSPGFVEDWVFAGAMTSDDVSVLVETIVLDGEADLATLCTSCRHYLGPALSPKMVWKKAASF